MRIETLVPTRSARQAVAGQTSVAKDGWWTAYRGRLSNLSEAAQRVLEEDSRAIANAALPVCADGALELGSWPASRVRSGIVVGSVQSGKTASSLGVCAHLLDRGVNIVVVLAGTRVALWMQTLERLLDKLDGSTPSTAWKRNEKRVLVPEPEDILNSQARLPARQYLPSRKFMAAKALREGRPILVVVPKEDDHLLELGKFLEAICPNEFLDLCPRPLGMVVLDDEADDASVLDALESGRVTPQFIQRLWGDRLSGDFSRHEKLLASYVAYTATPQANFLQRSHNPLAPRDFAISLRVPLDHGLPGDASFVEPSGVGGYYCGGELFYERYRNVPGDMCIAPPAVSPRAGELIEDFERRFSAQREALLGDALRSYFVSGAMRLIVEARTLSSLVQSVPQRLDQLRRILPPPHSMLFHPSALRDSHFLGAESIARWSHEHADVQFQQVEGVVAPLSAEGLRRRLLAEEDLWRAWFDGFVESASVLALLPGASYASISGCTWEEVKRCLQLEVFPHTKVRVLNSDDRADDRPHFEPVKDLGSEDLFSPPPDVYTIFVAGNVLSRGLTVDGLCTSLFLRGSNEPVADTQMQMQRWFGYRGRHLPFCRVFMLDDQLELFRQYHENDEALKLELRRRQSSASWSDALVLEGEEFRATGKVDSRKAPLHPGPSPAIKLVEATSSTLASGNLKIVSDLAAAGNWVPIEQPHGTKRGVVRTEPLDLLEVANILERLRYSRHSPHPTESIHLRWGQLRNLLGLDAPLFRPPDSNQVGSLVEPASCPYSVAAYLRLWAVMLHTRTGPGLFPTDAIRLPWNLIDLEEYRRTAPRFYVAIRFGEEAPALDPILFNLGVKTVRRSIAPNGGAVRALWGTRGTGGTYFGDQMMDYHFHPTRPVPRLHEEPLWRPRGHPGLLLFYIASTALGDQPLVGLGLPHGGPDHIAALRAGTTA